MTSLHEKVTTVPVPALYAFEPPGAARATAMALSYMPIEGFQGHALQDVAQSV